MRPKPQKVIEEPLHGPFKVHRLNVLVICFAAATYIQYTKNKRLNVDRQSVWWTFPRYLK